MNIVSYLNDPYSIERALQHLTDMLTCHSSELKKQVIKKGVLPLSFGELDSRGNFIELKLPKAFKQKFSKAKSLTSELLFFEILAQQNCFDEGLEHLCSAIIDFNRNHHPLWSDPSTFLGINILIPLALKSDKYIPSLIHLLSSVHLNKEMALSSDLDRVFNHHTWTPFTIELLAARATILKGKYGIKQVKHQLQRTDLQTFLHSELNQNLLLEKLTEYALFHYSELGGESSPETVIEQALNTFKNLSEAFSHKSQFLKKSFIEHFPNYLPCHSQLFNDHHPR